MLIEERKEECKPTPDKDADLMAANLYDKADGTRSVPASVNSGLTQSVGSRIEQPQERAVFTLNLNQTAKPKKEQPSGELLFKV